MKDFYCALLVAFFSAVASTYSGMFLYTYLPEMVVWMGYEEEEKGAQVGIVASSYALGSFVANYPLGLIADKFGHRKTLIILLLMNALFCLSFAFCTTITAMVPLWFLAGTCHAISPLCRAITAVFSNESNHVLGMACYGTAWCMGMIIGLSLGGYLASPSLKYPTVFAAEGFLADFPYILPPLFASFFSIIAAILTFFLCPIYHHIFNMTIDVNVSKAATPLTNGLKNAEHEFDDIVPNGKLDNDSNNCHDHSPMLENGNITHHKQTRSKLRKFHETIVNSTIIKLFKNANFMRSSLIYSINSMVAITHIELFSVWASTRTYLGGIAYSTDQIGTILLIIMIPCVILVPTLLPTISKKIGTIGTGVTFIAISAIAVSLTSQSWLIYDNSTQWWTVLTTLFVVHFCATIGSSTIQVVINSSVDKTQVGAANGLSQTLSSLGKSLGPLFGGIIFSSSVSSDFGAPMDTNLVFVLLGFCSFLNCILEYTLPSYLNIK